VDLFSECFDKAVELIERSHERRALELVCPLADFTRRFTP
jgi:hypothetical protein